jgi:hypothetical protein
MEINWEVLSFTAWAVVIIAVVKCSFWLKAAKSIGSPGR